MNQASTPATAAAPLSEQLRLQSLLGYAVLDTAAEADFDDITELAALMFDVPIALISLVDSDRQWFKSRVGLAATQTPREIAFCDHAIRGRDLLVVPDALADARFAHNPLVVGEPGVRFYAGAPLLTPQGQALGTLCVIDRRPRGFDAGQGNALQVLSRQVMAQLELRRKNAALARSVATLRAEREQLQQARQALEASELRMDLVLKGSNDGWWDWNLVSGERYCSPRGWAMLGYEDQELPYDQRLWQQLVLAEDLVPLLRAVDQALRGDTGHCTAELRLRHKDGHVVPVLSRGYVLRDARGRATRFSGTNTDLSEARRAEGERRELQENAAALFANSIDGVLQTRPDGSVQAANAAACAMLGYSEAEIRQLDRDRLMDVGDERLAPLLAERARLGHARGELRMIRSNGEAFEVEVSSSIFTDRHGQPLAAAVFRDISERKRAEAQTHHLAHFDALTGLPNRRLLLQRIDQALSSARRSGQCGALLYIDLDNFKQINDARGHAVGDSLLRQVATRLRQELRSDDAVARLGGDEFVVLVGNLGADVEGAALNARAVADKLRALLEKPFEIDGAVYGSAGSIGITLFPKAGEHEEDLLREADIAMYRAKGAGGNRIAFFQAAMQAEVEERLCLEQDLKLAVAAGRLTVHLQPQYDARGVEVGGELLLRWHDARRGAVSPAQFIPVAEESGLILPLGDFVIRQACEALVSLRAGGMLVPLSVNVSPRQFRKDDFVDRVRAILAETGAPAAALVFEVTEGLLIEDWEATLARMSALVALGIRFSIDDFGTGYSSLGYLKRLPLYELKIDRSFVRDTPDDPSGTAIVQSILSVAKHLGLHVVAEGVETRAQADFLAANRCDCLQGFFFARPHPLQDWLAQRLATARPRALTGP